MHLKRRTLLKLAGTAAAASYTTAAAAHAHTPSATTAAATTISASQQPRWPGHHPGKVVLGCAGQHWDQTVSRLGQLGVHRSFYQWHLSQRERRTITADHAADRLPWVSFKPPKGARSWPAIAAGHYDADIRARARFYAAFGRPIIVTFHHEPADDWPNGGAHFSAAWCRIHDVMMEETGLENVASAPIIGDWTFNPWNRRDDPHDWVTEEMLDRSDFFGLDLYHNQSQKGYAERIGQVVELLSKRGHPDKMIGLGETGATSDFPETTAAQWWQQQWAWAEANADRLGVVAYYNSSPAHSRRDWTLWADPAKFRAFRQSLESPVSVRSISGRV